MRLKGERIVVEILFLVTLPAITKSQPHAQCHHSKGRSHQDCDSLTNGLLPIFGSCRGRAVAHGTALREGGDRPQAQKPNQHGALYRTPHFTPNERMRNASGKKTIIMPRQNASEHMVRYFMRDTSHFICMKSPM